jgi:hypothetical protein
MDGSILLNPGTEDCTLKVKICQEKIDKLYYFYIMDSHE